MTRWRIARGPEHVDDDVWRFTLSRGRRTREIRAHVSRWVPGLRRGGWESHALDLVESHLNDRVPPDEVSLSLGWNFVEQEPAVAEIGLTQIRGPHMRLAQIARGLNLPHWLQPRR